MKKDEVFICQATDVKLVMAVEAFNKGRISA